MGRKQSLFETQTKGLLLRTWHWQRRQHCTNLCTIVIPPLFLVLLYVLSQVIKGREVISEDFERDPRGAFVPRPFNPDKCLPEFSNPDAAPDVPDLRLCPDPFVPKHNVAVAVSNSLATAAGSRDANNPQTDSGLLQGLSLEPYIYPPALPGNAFFDTQTRYDGVFLHAGFEGDISNDIYQAFLAAEQNGTIDERFSVKTQRFTTEKQMRDNIYDGWFKGNKLGSYANALAFDDLSVDDTGVRVAATVYFNESESTNCTEGCQVVSNVMRTHNAIYQSLMPGKTAIAYLRRMPLIDVELDLDIIQLVLSIILGFTAHFWFPTFLHFLVYERVSRLRAMMSMMGLKRREYWFGTYVGMLIEYTLSKVVIIVIGAVVGISFFVDNTPLSYLILFFLWGNVLIAFAMAFAPFFGNPETAQVIAWLVIILVNIVGGPYLGQRLSDDRTSEGTWSAIMLLPSFAFLRSVYYAGALNAGGKGVTLGSEQYRDFELGMCSGNGPFCRSYIFLAVQWVILMLFAAYFDRVLPGAVGNRLHPLFFLGFKRKTKYAHNEDIDVSHEGPDVLEEDARAQALVDNIASDPFDGVVINKLSKTYPAKPPVKAVKGLSLVANKSEVLCILAHNGGGKTTMFRTLVGELEASSGTAYICGNSILTDMAKVHRLTGVAPQQDILWDVVSAQEHLYFYGRVKNLSGPALKNAVEESLEAVQLTFARKRRVSALSGGMKRRLSVSIAMIGSPEFIILDEPSTGLDILARERLWEAIDRIKENKAILLTTHSLEEAEALSNRVAIMSHGKLKCIGKSEELKLRLGKGHHLSVSLPSTKVGALHDAITELAPGATIETQLGGNVEYVLPKSFAIPEVFGLMERKRDLLEIRDWSINQSTLEDVFLAVTQQDRSEQEKKEKGMEP